MVRALGTFVRASVSFGFQEGQDAWSIVLYWPLLPHSFLHDFFQGFEGEPLSK